jgi:hypothetical protein
MSLIFTRPIFPWLDRLRWSRWRGSAMKVGGAFFAGALCAGVLAKLPAGSSDGPPWTPPAPTTAPAKAAEKPAAVPAPKPKVAEKPRAPEKRAAKVPAPPAPPAVTEPEVVSEPPVPGRETTGTAAREVPKLDLATAPSAPTSPPAASAVPAAAEQVAAEPTAQPAPVVHAAEKNARSKSRPAKLAARSGARASKSAGPARLRTLQARNEAEGFGLVRAYRLPDGRRVTLFRRYDGPALAYGDLRSPRRMGGPFDNFTDDEPW